VQPPAGTKTAATTKATQGQPTKTAPATTKTVTPAPTKTAVPPKPIVLPQASKPADEGIIARLKRLIGLGEKPVPAPAQTKKTAAASTPQTKSAPPPTTPQTKTAANPPAAAGAKTQPPAQTKAGTTPAKTAPAQVQPKSPAPATKTAAAPSPQIRPGAPATPPASTPRTLNVVTTDTALAKPLVIMREVFVYDPAGRRDPFVSLLTTNDLRPTLSDLKLMGTVVDEPGRSVALLLDNSQTRPDRKQVSVRVGSRLGRMRVASIRSNVVVFSITEFGMNRIDSLLLRDSTKARGR
jgi:hypothetical protein